MTVSSINFKGVNEGSDRQEITPMKTALVTFAITAPIVGYGVDTYLNFSKKIPKDKLKIINEVEKSLDKLPKESFEKVSSAIKATKSHLEEIISTKYTFFEKFGISQIRNHSDLAMKELASLNLEDDALKSLASNKHFVKLVEIGKKLSKQFAEESSFLKTIIKQGWRDNKYTIVLSALSFMISTYIKSQRTQKIKQD